MMRRSRISVATVAARVAAVGMAVTLLAACGDDDDQAADDNTTSTTQPASSESSSTTAAGGEAPSTTTTVPASTPSTLKPPDADAPAAGTCGTSQDEVVEVTINPDIPSPRCVQVTADQRLRIVNRADQPCDVSLAQFSATLQPGESTDFDMPFGDYLEPGVHRVGMSIYGSSGAEVWLQ
jgi:hypothetical protein